jgi:hypothetical protein
MAAKTLLITARLAKNLIAAIDNYPLHWLALLLPLLLLLASCSTTKTYKPGEVTAPAKPPDYPIPLYTEDQRIPRPCQLIGVFSIGDTQLTMFGGSMKGVMMTLMETAHKKGADVVELTSIRPPDFTSANYRLEAKLLRYADTWEKVNLSEKDFLTYLQQHRQTLDPIEGIWSDGSPDRIGIIRDHSKPGRDFIGFKLDAGLPSWHPGDKKIDVARDSRPGEYSIKYYRDDFELTKTSVRLDHNLEFNFIIRKGEEASEVIFTKIGAPLPVN